MAPPVTRRRPVIVFFTAVFAIIAYFTLLPYPLGTETVARPVWVAAIPSPNDPAASAAPEREQVPALFQLGGVFGYVDGQGRFAHVEKTLYRVALSDTGFVNYTRLGTDWILHDVRGRRVLSFSGSGYPLLSPDGSRIFVVKSDLSGLVEMGNGGETRWERDFASLLTTLSVQGSSLLAGLLDGSMVFIDPRGAAIVLAAARSSRIPVLFGAAVTGDGSVAASLSGIDPQVLTVYSRREGVFEPRSTQVLATDFRREVRMAFSPKGRYLAFEDGSAVGLFDLAAGRSSRVALRGPLTGIAFPAEGRLAAAAAVAGGHADLAVFSPFVGPVFRETFAAPDLFVGTVDGQLLLGLDGRLMRIDMVAM